VSALEPASGLLQSKRRPVVVPRVWHQPWLESPPARQHEWCAGAGVVGQLQLERRPPDRTLWPWHHQPEQVEIEAAGPKGTSRWRRKRAPGSAARHSSSSGSGQDLVCFARAGAAGSPLPPAAPQ